MRKLILASLTISSAVAAQTPGARPRTAPLKGSLEQRLAQLIDVPPFNRATWGIYVVDDRGRVLYQRNADRFSVPASNTKLVVTAAAAVLLPADYRVTTSLYVNGRVEAGVLYGDLILYGRGDPTWSERCYSVDTLAPGVCDSAFTAMDAIADSLRARGLRRITGKLVGDGSYFEPTLIHYGWNAWDLTWWYAAPVSGLGFHDNSLDFHIAPARALATSLGRKGVAVAGGAMGTTDSLAYRAARCCGSPLVEYRGRPLSDVIFPILNTSQNWFAEMLLKVLGREIKGEGAWEAGLDVERRFLIDSVKIDSTAFALEDGSAFVAALPHAGQPGSLLKRFVGTPLEGRVIAKTGSIDRVNSLSGYIEQPNGRTVTFSVQANGHAVPYQQMLAQIDSVVVEIGKGR